MSTVDQVINGYVQNSEGKWILTDESKAESLAMYYQGRIAYDPQNSSHSIGRYNSVGEVVYFKGLDNSSKS